MPRRDDAGRLEADTLNYDFGMIDPKQKVTGEFILTNTGKETLEINKPRSDCGCTVPKLDTSRLEPGQSVPLSVAFTVRSTPGPMTKKVWVTTKPPGKPAKLTMRVTANVRKHIVVTPEKLQFELRELDKNDVTVILESSDGTPFKVTGYNARNKIVNIAFDKEAKAPRYRLKLTPNLDVLRKMQRGAITINIDHPKLNKVTIPYVATAPFVAHPATRPFVNMEPDVEKKSYVKVVSSFGEEFELGEITSKRGFVKVLGTSKEETGGYRVDLAMVLPGDKKNLVDTVVIDIKDHPQDSIKVRCYARVRSSARAGVKNHRATVKKNAPISK